MHNIVQALKKARSVVLSTHRECDGDGLGAQIALYYALKKIGKNVRVLNVDTVPPKYDFLEHASFLEVFEKPHKPLQATDIGLIFDTNDHRQLGELFPELEKHTAQLLFVDHHPILKDGPAPTSGSLIDTAAASTGEIVFGIIKALEIPLDVNMARALYTSIAFDTQVFRYIRTSPQSHIIAAELLRFDIKPDEIHQKLFCTHTIEKIRFLSQALGQIEYQLDGRLALLKIRDTDLTDHGLSTEETRDVIDMIMNIESVEAAVLFREDDPNTFKVSIRSKGGIEVLSTAEMLGGGGHRWAAGAIFKGSFETLKQNTLNSLIEKLKGRYGTSQK